MKQTDCIDSRILARFFTTFLQGNPLNLTPILVTRFYKQHFYKQRQADIGKNQANVKQNPAAELLLFKNYL